MRKIVAAVVAAGALVAAPAQGHVVQLDPPPVKQKRLKPLVNKMRDKVDDKGRDVINHGRERDGRFTWNRLRRQYRNYWRQLHPPEPHKHYVERRYPAISTPPAYIAQCESGGDPTVVGFTGRHYGKWQFDLSTWRSVGGSGYPHHASESEQDYRAGLLMQRRGLQPWACA